MQDNPHARLLLQSLGIRPKKHLGQNFLMDGGAAKRIAELTTAELQLPIVEIGPGTGALTRALLACDRAPRLIEIDPEMVAILRADPLFGQLEIATADALDYNYETVGSSGQWIACGNLPYNIGTPLLIDWVESATPPARIVVMLQRDVADRITAEPGSKSYSSLSITAQIVMRARRAFTLKPQAFYPKPTIDSAVVVLDRLPQPRVSAELVGPTRLVARAAFAYRRKTLANSLALSRGYERTAIEAALNAAGLNPQVRGEEVSIEQFAAVAQFLLNAGIAITNDRIDS